MAQGGYMDDVRVKIVEKYKPPPRINLAMSYAQRLTLNKQIQDTIPQYEFVLEKTVIEKMKEWRTARSVMFQQVNERVQKAMEEREKNKDEAVEYDIDKEEKEVASIQAGADQFQQNQIPLIPTQAGNNSFSNILTPIPLKEQTFNQSHDFKSPEKSPFNISDFEADNYSPFDNMELKSINDMEELAQVLKRDQDPKLTQPMAAPSSNSYTMVGATNYNYTIPNSTSYVHPSYYANTNGYYYPPETINRNQSFSTPYSYSNHIDNKYSTSPVQEIRSHKSIPDIMKALEKEIKNTHLDNTGKVPEVIPNVKTKSEESSDEYNSLPKNVQDMSKSISSMGFPLSRVARVCKVIGNDQKKVVEHLLAMSELLDLGFPESRVSSALLQCDNDRDKALDILIS